VFNLLSCAADNAPFNSMLVTMYRSGSDSIDWHADDEACLGPNPTVSSLSFGASRDFFLRKHVAHKVSVSVLHCGGRGKAFKS